MRVPSEDPDPSRELQARDRRSRDLQGPVCSSVRVPRRAESPVLEQVAGCISRYSMFPPEQRLGLAVSGGADSVFLLHALRELFPERKLTVVHVNHQLRGREADADEDFVRDLAAALDLPVVVDKPDLRRLDRNLEAAGRKARRAFFLRLIAEQTVDRVATGHTASDQAETVLYRLIRGSGATGLRGVLPVTREGIVRPLLDCWRDEIEAWLRGRSLPWRDDRTNRDPAFTRNRLRHCLLPQLEREFNPQIRKALAHLAALAVEDEGFLDRAVAEIAATAFTRLDDALVISSKLLSEQPLALARRLVRRALLDLRGDLRGIEYEHVEAVLGLAARQFGNGALDLPGVHVARSFDWVRFVVPIAGRSRPLIRLAACPVLGAVTGPPDWVRFVKLTDAGSGGDAADWVRFAKIAPAEVIAGGLSPPCPVEAPTANALLPCRIDGTLPIQVYNEDTDVIDAGRLPDKVEARSWQPGDRFESRPGHVHKLKELFHRGRIPVWERQDWPVLASGNAVVWTRRFGVAASYKCTEHTVRVLLVTEMPGREAGD